MEQPPWWAYSIMSLFFFVVLIVLNFIVNKINASRIEERFAKMEKTGNYPKQPPYQKLEIPSTEGNHTTSRDPQIVKTTQLQQNTRIDQEAGHPTSEGNSCRAELHDPGSFQTLDIRASFTDISKPQEPKCHTKDDVSKSLETNQCHTKDDVSKARETNQCHAEDDVSESLEANQCYAKDDDRKAIETNQCHTKDDVSKSLETNQCHTKDDVSKSLDGRYTKDVPKSRETNQYHTIDGEEVNIKECRISIIGGNNASGTNITESENDIVEIKERSPKQ